MIMATETLHQPCCVIDSSFPMASVDLTHSDRLHLWELLELTQQTSFLRPEFWRHLVLPKRDSKATVESKNAAAANLLWGDSPIRYIPCLAQELGERHLPAYMPRIRSCIGRDQKQ